MEKYVALEKKQQTEPGMAEYKWSQLMIAILDNGFVALYI